MHARLGSEVINLDRRQLLSTAATGFAAASAASRFPAYPAPAATSDEIRPFRINVPEEALGDLRRRINATRWPDRETVTDESQSVQLATIQELARYWATDYDWRKCEAKLNTLPEFLTEIDGLDVRFIHGLRVFSRAYHDRLGSGSHRTCLGSADEAPWILAICIARRRFGRGSLECDG